MTKLKNLLLKAKSADVALMIFKIQEDSIGISLTDCLLPTRHRSILHLTFINTAADPIILKAPAKIELRFNMGAGSGSLFSKQDTKGLGTFSCPDGFTATGWNSNPIKKNRYSCILQPVDRQSITLLPGKFLSFTWKDISSTAPEGYATITAVFSGIENMAAVTQTDFVFKKPAGPNISYFIASPTTGAPGDKLLLRWSIENAASGVLFPGGYDILGPVSERSSSLEITLDPSLNHYYLDLEGKDCNVFKDLNVFAAAPFIYSFGLKSRKELSWEVHFANHLMLLKDDSQEVVKATGSCILPEHTKMIALLCNGLYHTRRYKIVPPIPEIRNFSLDLQQYEAHQSVKLSWETEGFKSTTITGWDSESYILSMVEVGSWEQIYPLNTTLKYLLTCIQKDGTKVEAAITI